MKLLNKTSIYYLFFALPVFVLCSGLLYFFISTKIKENLDESLWKEKIKVEEKLNAGKNTSDLDDDMALKPISLTTLNMMDRFSDTLMYDSIEEEMLPFRVLTAIVNNDKNKYEFTIRKSYIESEDLIASILYPVLLLFIILLIGFFLINWFISKQLWNPFYKTLAQLNHFKIDEKPAKFDSTAIKEFSELNKVLSIMTEKIHTDFINQKQFIENASHEIQTPLAVIKTKIELLIQSTAISADDMHIIQSVYNASNKLSSLNKALLLLSKIENNQFTDLEEIQFKPLFEKIIDHFSDMISIKNIRIETKYEMPLTHKMNPVLADILISNLVQNAIRHNIKGGYIIIQLSENSILISNSSASTIVNTNELFQRFKKSEAFTESIGLGLAIVKEICDNYGIEINYTCSNSIHAFQLNF